MEAASREDEPNGYFNLKLHFSEGMLMHSLVSNGVNNLPRNIDQISKVSKMVAGMHPSTFLMGTRPNLKLF